MTLFWWQDRFGLDPQHVPLAPSIRRYSEAQLKQVRAGDLQVENLSIIVKDLQDRKMMGR